MVGVAWKGRAVALVAVALYATPALALYLTIGERDLIFGQPTVTVTDLSLVQTTGAVEALLERRDELFSPMERMDMPTGVQAYEAGYTFMKDPNRRNVKVDFHQEGRVIKQLRHDKALEKRFTNNWSGTTTTTATTFTPTASTVPYCGGTSNNDDNNAIVQAPSGYHYLIQCSTTYNAGGTSAVISSSTTADLASCIQLCDASATCDAAIFVNGACSLRSGYGSAQTTGQPVTSMAAVCVDCFAGTVQCPRDDGTTYTNQGITFTVQCYCSRSIGTTSFTGATVQSFDMCMQQCIGNTACLGASWVYTHAGNSGTCIQRYSIGASTSATDASCNKQYDRWAAVITSGRTISQTVKSLHLTF